MPRWLARLLHSPTATASDSPERAHERHKPQYPDRSVLENVDRAMFGAFTQPSKRGHPPPE
jgi:hypothetical protein